MARFPSAASRLHIGADAAARAPFPHTDVGLAALSAMEALADKVDPINYAIDTLQYASAAVGGERYATIVHVAAGEDAQKIARGILPQAVAGQPLWLGVLPPWVHDNWTELRALLLEDPTWEVWTKWYDARLKGSDRENESLELARAMIPDEIWQEGPSIVNAHIAELIGNHESKTDKTEGTDDFGAIPNQSAAPVRVEERGGKISVVSDRGSSLRAAERDFNAWREPVIDHIGELSSGDFRPGTNHSRIRERLVVLGTLLPGDLDEVKERQFRIGYEIERFEGLLAAYRSGADDMPALNAATLEDLSRLHVVLAMGIGKLDRWSEFRRQAADDPRREGDANRQSVAAALDRMATEMEHQSKYFDPELPRTFRFLAEAIKDPLGATKTVVYGGVKSAENLVSFLGQKALGIGKGAMDGVEKHISKAVAAVLILALGDTALTLSEALPQRWTWLRSLIDSLTKSSGH